MKTFFKKWLPKIQTLKKHPLLERFSQLYSKANLGCFDRHHVARGVAVGLLINFLPIPLQILWAFMLSVYFKTNLPVTVALTCINNPFTFVPINYLLYKVGVYVLGESPKTFLLPALKWDLHHLSNFCEQILSWLTSLGKPYILGIIIVSLTTGTLGFVLTHVIWSLYDSFKKLRN